MQPPSPPSTSKRSVFISHASKNFKLADEVRAVLEEKGISCWIAPRDIPAGGSYGTEIINGISQCSVFLLLLTNESNLSAPVRNEVERAFGYQKVIIPVRLADIKPAQDIEFFVSNAQWVDAIHTPLRKRMDEVAAIVHAVETASPLPPVPAEKKTLVGSAEKWAERAFRHKTLSFVGAFGGLALLILAGMYLQSRGVETIERSGTEISQAATSIKDSSAKISTIDEKIGGLKKEVSDDPKKELFSMGISFDVGEFLTNIDDEKVVALFMKAGKLNADKKYILMYVGTMPMTEGISKILPGGVYEIPTTGKCWANIGADDISDIENRVRVESLIKQKHTINFTDKLCEQSISQIIDRSIEHFEKLAKEKGDFSSKNSHEEWSKIKKKYDANS